MYYVCCMRSDVIWCKICIVLPTCAICASAPYLCHMCQCSLPVPYVPVQITSGALVRHRYTFALLAVPQDFYFLLSISVHGTIFLTLYSMVWDWRVLRTGPMLFYWPKLPARLLYVFSCFFFFLRALLFWGWGLRSDIESISLFRSCIAYYN